MRFGCGSTKRRSARPSRSRTGSFRRCRLFTSWRSLFIIDPTKVVRSAIQGAASIAGLLITTEAIVAEVPKKNQGAPAMPGGGMGGMDF